MSNKKPSQAVALRYGGKGVPTIGAKGKGAVAERILSLAKEHGIPLHEDPDLLVLLSKLELGQEIPSTLYLAVAEVLAHVHWLSVNHGKKLSETSQDEASPSPPSAPDAT